MSRGREKIKKKKKKKEAAARAGDAGPTRKGGVFGLLGGDQKQGGEVYYAATGLAMRGGDNEDRQAEA